MSGIEPNYATADRYEMRFRRARRRRDDGDARSRALRCSRMICNGSRDIVVLSGSNLQNLNLPIDPNGVVYDALSRAPIAGATVDARCRERRRRARVVLLRSEPAEPSHAGRRLLQVRSELRRSGLPERRQLSAASDSAVRNGTWPVCPHIIPPQSDAGTAAFVVPSCPASIDDTVPATAQHCEAAPSEFQPPASVAPRTSGTSYYLHLTFDSSFVPGSSQIFNNHIPLDLDLDESVTVTKTTPLVHVSRGQLVPYIITLANGIGVNLSGRHRRRPLPGRLPLRRRLGAARRGAARAGARRVGSSCGRASRSRPTAATSCSCCWPSARASAKASS